MKPGKFFDAFDHSGLFRDPKTYGVRCNCSPENKLIARAAPEPFEQVACERCGAKADLCGKKNPSGAFVCCLLAGHEQDGFSCLCSSGVVFNVPSPTPLPPPPPPVTLQVPRELARELRRLLVGHAADCYRKAHEADAVSDEREGDAWMELARTIER